MQFVSKFYVHPGYAVVLFIHGLTSMFKEQERRLRIQRGLLFIASVSLVSIGVLALLGLL